MKHEPQRHKSHQPTHAPLDEQEGCLNVAGYDVGFDELVGPSMAAKIVGLSPRSLRRLVSQGVTAPRTPSVEPILVPGH